jgi:predicted double-glycine peptidase
MGRCTQAITLILGLCFLTGISAPKLPPNYLPVPITPQATSYSCGAAALLSLMVYWKVYEGNEVDLYADLNTTPKDGTHPKKMCAMAKLNGLACIFQTGMTLKNLRESLKENYTVILDIQAWPDRKPNSGGSSWEDSWEAGHYVILIGMDNQYAYVMDPSIKTAYGFIPLKELLERWHDYETSTGVPEYHYNLGLLIKGKTALRQFPEALQPVD